MSEASDGGGGNSGAPANDGGGPATPFPLACAYCKGELSEPCKSCKFCGKALDQGDSGVPRCFNCKTPLFTPYQKICHECGAHNPNRSIPDQQQPDTIKPIPSPAQPQQPPPSSDDALLSGATTAPDPPLCAGDKKHYEGVQQTVSAQQPEGKDLSRHEEVQPEGEGDLPDIGGVGDSLGGVHEGQPGAVPPLPDTHGDIESTVSSAVSGSSKPPPSEPSQY